MSRPLTGRKILLMALAFFGVIIAVNMTMAYDALSTFPGVVVGDSYIASQHFNELRDAQQALGWSVSTRHAHGVLTISITGRDGKPAPVAELAALIGRPAEARDDRQLKLTRTPRGFQAPVALKSGEWLLRLKATAAGGIQFRQDLTLIVGG